MIYSYLDKNVKISTVKSAYVAELLGDPLRYKGHINDADANQLSNNGFYYLGANITNAMEWSFLIVFRFGSSSDVVQINIHNGAGNAYYRKCASGTWYNWIPL